MSLSGHDSEDDCSTLVSILVYEQNQNNVKLLAIVTMSFTIKFYQILMKSMDMYLGKYVSCVHSLLWTSK